MERTMPFDEDSSVQYGWEKYLQGDSLDILRSARAGRTNVRILCLVTTPTEECKGNEFKFNTQKSVMLEDPPEGFLEASVQDLRDAVGKHVLLYKGLNDSLIPYSGWVQEVDVDKHPCFPNVSRNDLILRRRGFYGYAYDDVILVVGGRIQHPVYVLKGSQLLGSIEYFGHLRRESLYGRPHCHLSPP